MVQRTRDGERAYEVITPLYEKVDKSTGDLTGIFINRGRIPVEYKDSKMHLTPANELSDVEGCLFESEGFDQFVA
jgi:cytochrome oxidase assembly protein ShyY1